MLPATCFTALLVTRSTWHTDSAKAQKAKEVLPPSMNGTSSPSSHKSSGQAHQMTAQQTHGTGTANHNTSGSLINRAEKDKSDKGIKVRPKQDSRQPSLDGSEYSAPKRLLERLWLIVVKAYGQ